ncbi:hypothetical protein SMD44_07349 [Streptomyces alboflavus]|uniref:Uncharacterized protein n=1 Tax=Streptomyces alboflavus TaxID=67267 RepID=A0A1Z1WN38_9ACTN|nr:hypothetical protein SMD44_07349 [Streptomyces alboflavus]
MGRLSQAIAMDLRYHLYASEPGAVYNTYPKGAGRPVLVEYTDAERAANTRKRDAVLKEWQSTDPEGFRLWSEATEAVRQGDDSQLSGGWSALILEQDGMRIVDPCRYCQVCRSRR